MDINDSITSVDSGMLGYRLRFRFRVDPRLDIDRKIYPFKIGGYRGKLSACNRGQLIKDVHWLSAVVIGFQSESVAHTFGVKLKRATSLVAAVWRIGVDVGEDIATTSVGDVIRRMMIDDHGVNILNDVHGLTIYSDSPAMLISSSGATITTSTRADGPFRDVASLIGVVASEDSREYQAALLLNAAIINPDALARMVLAISAVELLAGGKGWTDVQCKAINDLAARIELMSTLADVEKAELRAALLRLQPQSITAGVGQLMRSLGLGELKHDWDKIYRQRSTIFHAKKYLSAGARNVGTDKVVGLCRRIVLAALDAKHSGIGLNYAAMYPSETPHRP